MAFPWMAVASVAGDILGGMFGENSAEEQREAQMQMMERQHELNVYDYTHRHQWEVSDLKKAGLNPILSANSAGSVAPTSMGSAAINPHPYDIGKTLNAIANSALVKKETDLKEYQAETDRMHAEADVLRAENDKARTPSAIGLQESQAGLAVKQAEMLDKNYDLQKLYTEANIREIDQRIINSVMEVEAKVKYLEESGRAALMSASAHQASAAAAMRSAEAQEIIAQVAEANGISQRQLNDALEGKASAETKEAYERAAKLQTEKGVLDWQVQKDKVHNPYAESDGLGRMFMGVGEILRNGISGGAGFMP